MVSKYKLNAAFAVRNRSGKISNGPKKNDSKHKLNATFAVRNRSGKMCNGPKRSNQNTTERCLCGPESVRKDLQRSQKKQSKYKLYAAFAVRNRSGQIYNGPTSNDQHIYELNFAVRNRSGKIFNGPTRSNQNTS